MSITWREFVDRSRMFLTQLRGSGARGRLCAFLDGARPGADASHKTHVHLDLQERRHATKCVNGNLQPPQRLRASLQHQKQRQGRTNLRDMWSAYPLPGALINIPLPRTCLHALLKLSASRKRALPPFCSKSGV